MVCRGGRRRRKCRCWRAVAGVEDDAELGHLAFHAHHSPPKKRRPVRDAGDVVVHYRAGASGAVVIDGVSEVPAIDLFVVRHQQLVHFARGISGAKSATDVGDVVEERRNGAEMAVE